MSPPGVLRILRVRNLDGIATIDLSSVGWVTPSVMVGVAALAHRAANAGEPFAVIGPIAENVSGYLARMRLGSVLNELGAVHNLPATSLASDRTNDLLEVSPVTTEQDARGLATLVEANVSQDDPGLASALFDSLAEVGDNVAEHALCTGYMAAQKIVATDDLHIAVADGGVGLLHWLGRKDATDTEALDSALAGVSRFTDDSERGGGLLRSLAIIARMSGTATFASGDAWSRDRQGDRERGTCPDHFTGALFEARIPLRQVRRGC